MLGCQPLGHAGMKNAPKKIVDGRLWTRCITVKHGEFTASSRRCPGVAPEGHDAFTARQGAPRSAPASSRRGPLLHGTPRGTFTAWPLLNRGYTVLSLGKHRGTLWPTGSMPGCTVVKNVLPACSRRSRRQRGFKQVYPHVFFLNMFKN